MVTLSEKRREMKEKMATANKGEESYSKLTCSQ